MAASVSHAPASILSIDVGSSSVRAGLFDESGEHVPGTESRRAHRFFYPGGGRVEADPPALAGLVAECIDETLAGSAAPRAVSAVSVCTFLHSLVGIADNGDAVTPVLTWEDSRSADQAARLAALLDAEEVRQRTGCPLHSLYAPARLAWFREHEPRLFEAAAWWGSFGEYCRRLFTGARSCSLSIASATGLLNRSTPAWDEDLLRAVGLDRSRLSPLEEGPTGARLLPRWASRWPPLRDSEWFSPLGDGACSSVGCGCGSPGRAALMIGTTGAVRMVRTADGAGVPPGLWVYRLDRSRELVGGVLGDGGNLFHWMGETLDLGTSVAEAEAALLSAAPAGHGLVVLPFLSGERSMGWNPAVRGAILGLRQDTTALDILQAGVESVAYRFAAIVHALQAGVPDPIELVGTGGALLSSASWGQVLADVLERPLSCSAEPEASSRGAALLALRALGVEGGTREELRIGRTFSPRPHTAAAHRAAFREQERCRAALFGNAVSGGVPPG
jgi:gluconokinase